MTRPSASEKRYTPGCSGMDPDAGRYASGWRVERDEGAAATATTLGGCADTADGADQRAALRRAARPGRRLSPVQTSTTTLSPLTVTGVSASGLVAGGFTTEPSLMENLLPWHLQLMEPPATSATGHPMWVQILLNALKSPLVGWVIT